MSIKNLLIKKKLNLFYYYYMIFNITKLILALSIYFTGFLVKSKKILAV